MSNKNFIPYIITIFGTLNTENTDFEKKKEELLDTNIEYLISNSNEKFVEIDEDKI